MSVRRGEWWSKEEKGLVAEMCGDGERISWGFPLAPVLAPVLDSGRLWMTMCAPLQRRPCSQHHQHHQHPRTLLVFHTSQIKTKVRLARQGVFSSLDPTCVYNLRIFLFQRLCCGRSSLTRSFLFLNVCRFWGGSC